ncbi:hypothetical protein STSP_37370 [Streptomyces jeddahensis]|uniref:DUF2267 domain-containing protein n=2 Tax=Streptomyces jeddahensis TaxID=1716141 RepID=A0A177HR26_9ACTN|nr:hypothetical protein STSP_37370 [Streptomyces jeddahensis]
MQLEEFLDDIRVRGGYDSPLSAAQAAEAALEILGAHLVGDDLIDLARLLPHQCTPVLACTAPASEPLTPSAFIAAVADRTDGDLLAGRRHATAVLSAITAAADEAVLTRLITQLPPGYDELFGHAEPVVATSA